VVRTRIEGGGGGWKVESVEPEEEEEKERRQGSWISHWFHLICDKTRKREGNKGNDFTNPLPNFRTFALITNLHRNF
jgi:hypothetical protein